MAFDGTCGDEQGLGDLPVREAVSGEFGDTPFTGCQGVRAGQHGAAGPGAGGTKLGFGPGGQGRGAEGNVATIRVAGLAWAQVQDAFAGDQSEKRRSVGTVAAAHP